MVHAAAPVCICQRRRRWQAATRQVLNFVVVIVLYMMIHLATLQSDSKSNSKHDQARSSRGKSCVPFIKGFVIMSGRHEKRIERDFSKVKMW